MTKKIEPTDPNAANTKASEIEAETRKTAAGKLGHRKAGALKVKGRKSAGAKVHP